jgi:L-ascorbate metabolism protein UlaG (beta-lactamase superfamily)
VQIHELAEGEKIQVTDVTITALPANHDLRLSIPRPVVPCVGYVMQNHFSVYFAGDTDLFEEMYDIGQAFALDLALLPVWGYGHRLGNGHLNPLTAAQALTRLQPRIAVPIHWGSLRFPGPDSLWQAAPHMNTPPYAFANHAAYLSPETQVRILRPGQWTAIN